MIKINSNIKIKIAEILIKKISVSINNSAFFELNKCAAEYHSRFKNKTISDIDNTIFARKLFRDIGVDPTKKRPSSEALLRRAIKGKDLYKVNSLVDVCNWCSLDFLLPIGIYDNDKINYPVELRIGKTNESYIGIDNRELHLAGRYLLADQSGAFGSPIKDSIHTSISTTAKSTLIVLFAPYTYDTGILQNQAETMSARVLKFCGGEVFDKQIYY